MSAHRLAFPHFHNTGPAPVSSSNLQQSAPCLAPLTRSLTSLSLTQAVLESWDLFPQPQTHSWCVPSEFMDSGSQLGVMAANICFCGMWFRGPFSVYPGFVFLTLGSFLSVGPGCLLLGKGKIYRFRILVVFKSDLNLQEMQDRRALLELFQQAVGSSQYQAQEMNQNRLQLACITFYWPGLRQLAAVLDILGWYWFCCAC